MITIYVINKTRCEPEVSFLLFFHLFAVFLFNHVMFDPGYMGDQVHYFDRAFRYRNGLSDLSEGRFDKEGFASRLYAFFPIPFIETIYSVCLINYLLFVGLFMLLRRNNFLFALDKWVYLLYPSLLLYSSLALRDWMVTFCMVVLGLCVFQRRYLFMALFLWLLLTLKTQNFLIFLAAYAGYALFSNRVSFGMRLALLGATGAVIGAFREWFSLDRLNLYRKAMYWEDFRNYDNYEGIEGYGDLLWKTLTSIPYMLLKPLPWEAGSAFQLVQSLENLGLFLLVCYAAWNTRKCRLPGNPVLFVNLYFFIGMAVNGLVVSNFGTAVRYKFPFVVFYLVFSLGLWRQWKQGREDSGLLVEKPDWRQDDGPVASVEKERS
ncbi:MAG: hypothetical protein HQL56_09320 [Magnetococcales bacterium]|nr:hypothetical protein [Magnetococcales bacterium]